MDAPEVAAGSPGFAEEVQVARRPTLARRAALILATLAVATLALAARADAFVYWTTGSSGTIGRANLDGTGVNQSFITGVGTSPDGVAVDGAHVYWTNFDTDAIGRANLDGTGVNQSFIAGANCGSSPIYGVAVDGAHVYWAQRPAPARSGAPTSTAPASTRLHQRRHFPAGGVAVDGRPRLLGDSTGLS